MIEPAARICVIVPCYNEARRLNAGTFREFLTGQTDTCLLFVDDGSTDGTGSMLEAFSREFKCGTRILHLERNQGKAEAVRQGILFALDRFSPAIVGFWDADLATPLSAVAQFLDVLCHHPNIEMIFGARVQLLGRYVKRRALRHYLGRIFATAVSAVLNLPIYDTQCGAKLFRVRAETRTVFAEPFLSKWVFDVEILARYKQLYHREHKSLADAVYEFPLESWVDVAGSKVHPIDFFIAFRDIVRIRNRYLS